MNTQKKRRYFISFIMIYIPLIMIFTSITAISSPSTNDNIVKYTLSPQSQIMKLEVKALSLEIGRIIGNHNGNSAEIKDAVITYLNNLGFTESKPDYNAKNTYTFIEDLFFVTVGEGTNNIYPPMIQGRIGRNES